MPSPERLDSFRRWVALPLLVLYCLVLIIAAVPFAARFAPFAVVQNAANHVLSTLGWPAGLSVFMDRNDARWATRMTCVRVDGRTADGSMRVLYDDFPRCRDGTVEVSKSPLRGFVTRSLFDGSKRLRSNQPVDLNEYPMTAFFAVADHFCLELEPARTPGSSITLSIVTIRSDIQTGEGDVQRVRAGVHHCAEGTWESN